MHKRFIFQKLLFVEVLWAILDAKLFKNEKIKKKRGLKKAITRVWRSVTPETCQRLINAVPSRLRAIIKKNGRRLLGRRTEAAWVNVQRQWFSFGKADTHDNIFKTSTTKKKRTKIENVSKQNSRFARTKHTRTKTYHFYEGVQSWRRVIFASMFVLAWNMRIKSHGFA